MFRARGFFFSMRLLNLVVEPSECHHPAWMLIALSLLNDLGFPAIHGIIAQLLPVGCPN
jgi:hypothetical protein